LLHTEPPAELAELAENIKDEGGAVLAAYREPLGGHSLLFAALPASKIEPTPYQRDISDAHVRKLTLALDKTRRYLDPIIVVREPKEGKASYWTPNGFHRLTAMQELGAKSILALVVPEPQVAYQILALNIEKPHNLRERALSVARMYGEILNEAAGKSEKDFALEFEEPSLLTLGFAYQEKGRLSGGAYQSILRKVDGWFPGKLESSQEKRRERTRMLLDFDDAVTNAVAALKAKGFTSPYLRTFVVARVNPLRFMKTVPPFDELIPSLTKRVRGMKVEKINEKDISRTGGGPAETE
ncbi:MAG: ParB N-terminal domain-containing protein, partial [Spirochaetia bacterium]|nr:ParB N-terminal domain-containing protein [Spirochaetia bacterium]